MPISTRWDFDARRDVRVSADGWSWRRIPLAEAERRAGLPKGSLPPHSDSTRTDLWADERMRNPAFIALLTILSAHPEVVFYHVDWRSWVHLPHPREYPHRDDSAVADRARPDQLHGRRPPLPLSARRQRRHGALRLLALPAAGGRQQPRRHPGARHLRHAL